MARVLFAGHHFDADGATRCALGLMQHWVQGRGWAVQVLCDPARTPGQVLQAMVAAGATPVTQADTAGFDAAVLQGTGHMAQLEPLLARLPSLLWMHSGRALLLNEPATTRQWWHWFNLARAIVMPSAWLRDVAYRSLLSDNALARCHVQASPVWPEPAAPEPAPTWFAPPIPGRLRLLWVGVFSDLKRPQDLLDAALALQQPLDIVMVGPLNLVGSIDSVTLRSVLGSAGQQARPFGAHRLQVTGPLAPATVRALMRQTDVLVSTSTEETQGLVAAEAAQAGAALLLTDLPVYRPDWGGHWAHGHNAWLVPARQPAALAEALGHLAAQPALRKQLAQAAQAAAMPLAPAPFLAAMDTVMDGMLAEMQD